MENFKFKTKEYMERFGFKVEDDVIIKMDVDVIAHFGNAPCLDIWDMHHRNIFPNYNLYSNFGHVVSYILETLDASEEDGFKFSSATDLRCRIVESGGQVIGVGSAYSNKFVLFNDLIKKEP